jgi:hypothetical protein
MIMAIACFEYINMDVGYNFVSIMKHTLALMFYFWWNFANFILKKMAQICQILKEKKLKLINFYDKF